MKTVAVLIYAEALESTVAECRRQIDLIPSDEYTFELFVNPDLDEAWRAAGERDFYIWLHGLVTPVEGALYSLLDLVLPGRPGPPRGDGPGRGRPHRQRRLQPEPAPDAAGPGDSRRLPDVRRPVRPRAAGGVSAHRRARRPLPRPARRLRLLHAGPQGRLSQRHRAGDVRPDPDRTLATDFVLDFRTKGLFSAIWYFLRSAFRRFVIHNLSVYE